MPEERCRAGVPGRERVHYEQCTRLMWHEGPHSYEIQFKPYVDETRLWIAWESTKPLAEEPQS